MTFVDILQKLRIMDRMEYVYLSAHLDDVPLSCGGQIRRLVRENQTVTAVTIFAGIPDLSGDTSPLIDNLHKLWGDVENMTEARREEDRRAATTLGMNCLQLDFLDCIYRKNPVTGQYFFTKFGDIMGSIKNEDASLPPLIADSVRTRFPQTTDARIFAPLAVGGHIDHRLTCLAGHLLRRSGYQVVFYEDFPYAEEPGATEKAQALLPDTLAWKEETVVLSENDIALKIEAVMCYESQLVMIFKDPIVTGPRVRAFIEKTGGERIWEHASKRGV